MEFKFGVPNNIISGVLEHQDLRKSGFIQLPVNVMSISRSSSCSKPCLKRQSNVSYPFQPIANIMKNQSPVHK